YRAVRAEARTAAHQRPSGVHVGRMAPCLVVAWPTKLSMTPILADEVFEIVKNDLKAPAGYDALPSSPTPTLARYPSQASQWFPLNQADPASPSVRLRWQPPNQEEPPTLSMRAPLRYHLTPRSRHCFNRHASSA